MPASGARVPEGVDETVPSVARIYDYFLGGKDNYAVDRAVGAQFIELVPELPRIARSNRQFLARTVRFLAEAGIGQFIDLGAGLPTSPNVHEVARSVIPDARVAYVDHDPVVLAYGNALFATGDGVIVVNADVRQPAVVLGDPDLQELIDFSQPFAVLLLAMMHFVSDEQNPNAMVAGYRDRIPPGGYLVISVGSSEGSLIDGADQKLAAEKIAAMYRAAGTPLVGRSPAEVMVWFEGCELEEPGLVQLPEWRPDNWAEARTTEIHMLGGVGRKL